MDITSNRMRDWACREIYRGSKPIVFVFPGVGRRHDKKEKFSTDVFWVFRNRENSFIASAYKLDTLECEVPVCTFKTVEFVVRWVKHGYFFRDEDYIPMNCERFVEALAFLDYIGIDEEMEVLENNMNDYVLSKNDFSKGVVKTVNEVYEFNVRMLYELAKADRVEGSLATSLLRIIGLDLYGHCDYITDKVDEEFKRHDMYRRMVLMARDHRKSLRKRGTKAV